MVRRTRCWLCVLLALLLFYGSLWLPQEHADRFDGLRYLLQRRSSWEGVITVWQVSTWRVASGTRDGTLQAALRQVEKACHGVFFRMESLDVATCLERMARGERPDVLSFPGGMGLPEGEWLAFEPPAPLNGYAAACHTSRCLPWMMTGQALLINAPLAQDVGFDPQSCPDGAALFNAMDALSQAESGRRKPVLTAPLAAHSWARAAWIAEQVTFPMDDEWITDRMAFDRFAEGKAVVCLATPWEEAAIGRLAEKGRGFALTAVPLPQDLPLWMDVQYVALADPHLAGKAEVLCQVAAALFSPAIQQRVTEGCGCLAVTAEVESELTPMQQAVLAYRGTVYACHPEQALSESTLLSSQHDPSALQTLRERVIRFACAD